MALSVGAGGAAFWSGRISITHAWTVAASSSEEA